VPYGEGTFLRVIAKALMLVIPLNLRFVAVCAGYILAVNLAMVRVCFEGVLGRWR